MNVRLKLWTGLLVILSACENSEPIITIVDTGEHDRITLGKQLRIINRHAPRVVALDFFLVPDSAGVDSILVKELAGAKKTILAAGLHNPLGSSDAWDSLELSHPKFKSSAYGFVNLSQEDSVLRRELPMQQFFRSQPVYAFSYVVADNSFGVKPGYRNRGSDYLELPINDFKDYKLITSSELLSGEFDKSDIKDKIVIMGYIGKKEDFMYIDKKLPKVNGVEIHAAIINELVDR